MNDNLWRHQKDAIQFTLDHWRGGRHGVMLGMAMGCVEGDAEVIVNRGGAGRRTNLRTLYQKFYNAWDTSIPTQIKSLIGNELHLNQVLTVIAQGIRPVVRVQLASGKSIRITPDHEIAAPNDQWIHAENLRPGDQVLVNGTAVCRQCGSNHRIVRESRKNQEHVGLCRSCVNRRTHPISETGKIIDKDGYVRLYGMGRHPRANKAGQVYEHIVVMEQVLGRPITAAEHIHHKDHIRHHNEPDNLEVLPVGEHHRLHGKDGAYLHLDTAPRVCFIPKTDTVVSVEPDGETDVYDLQMANPGNNFVANGIIVHNCGKTRTAIELAVEMDLAPILILCPVRVIDVWREQLNLVAPGRYQFLGLGKRAGLIREKTERAQRLMEWAAAAQQADGRRVALAINYESARQEPFAHWSLNRPWPLVILDESHRAKTASSAISKYAGQLGLRTRYRLALTGTPMPHSPLDIWAQYRFLDRTIYDLTYTSFKQRYAVFNEFYPKPVAWRELEDLRERFETIAFQVSNEVLDLPPEMDQTFTTELGGSARSLYDKMEEDFIAWLAETGTAVVADNAAVRLLRLQQIACGSTRDEAGNDIIVSTAKENLLQDLLEDLGPEEPVVVFARFRADLAAVHRTAERLGLKSAELSGRRDTSALWQRARKNDPTILAVQMQAGSEGISLVRARYAIYYSTGFSLGLYLQSRARLRRPGQTRPVMFYHLVVDDTVDEYVIQALAQRQDLVEGVLARIKEKRHVLPRPHHAPSRTAGARPGTTPSGSL